MMPWSSSVFSRSARMLEEMPSSDLVNSSRKCRRLPNIMSRMIRRLHLSPTTSNVRLIGQPERWTSSMGGIQTCGETPRKDRLQYCTSYLRIQPVAIRKRLERKRDGETDHVEPDDARRFRRRAKPRYLLAFRRLGGGTGKTVDRPVEFRRGADVRPRHLRTDGAALAERDRRGRGLHERIAEICVVAHADEIQLEQHPDVQRRCCRYGRTIEA